LFIQLYYNAVCLLDTPKAFVIDGGMIICKHICLIQIHGASVLPNPYLYLILFKSISIQVYFGGIEQSKTPPPHFQQQKYCQPFRHTDDKGQKITSGLCKSAKKL